MNAGREWRSLAACAGTDPDLFPTAEIGAIYDAQVAAAKAICARCPVLVQCPAEARIPEGIAGGLTPDERRRLRRPSVLAVRAEALTETQYGEREAAGRVLLAAGRPDREVAHRCGVSERTAARWAARARVAAVTAGEGSTGGNRAPLQISHTPSAPAKDTHAGRNEPR